MKAKKTISAILAGVMLTMGAYSFAIAEENEVIYTYLNESGNTVNITQAQLDAEHWNVDALGGEIPDIYEKFPMSITGYVNDFAEISLDIVYMKKLQDMDSVILTLTDMETENIIYNKQLTEYSFYSPKLQEGRQYELKLTEICNGLTEKYSKIIMINKSVAEMPEYVYNPSASDENVILIADIDRLKEEYTINENGTCIINTGVTSYEKVAPIQFDAYVSGLPQNKVYRVYARANDTQYAGFINTNECNVIYTYEAAVYDWDDMYKTLAANACDSVSYADMSRNSSYLRLTDQFFRTYDNGDVSGAYRAFGITIPEDVVAKYLQDVDEGNLDDVPSFRIKVVGDSQIKMRIWQHVGSNLKELEYKTSSNNANSLTYSLPLDRFNIKSGDGISMYFMVYFPIAVEGMGRISYSPVIGYEDDVTGSVYDACHNSSALAEMSNREFSLTDGWDVDTFYINYSCDDGRVYKIEYKNRGLEDQAKLDSGIYAEGSSAVYLTAVSAGMSGGTFRWSDSAVYSVAKNSDVTLYNKVGYDPDVISIQTQATGIKKVNKYQLSYKLMPISE